MCPEVWLLIHCKHFQLSMAIFHEYIFDSNHDYITLNKWVFTVNILSLSNLKYVSCLLRLLVADQHFCLTNNYAKYDNRMIQIWLLYTPNLINRMTTVIG